jgi:hypothetical protein
MVSGLKSDDYSERLAELGLPTHEEWRHPAELAMVHRIILEEEARSSLNCLRERQIVLARPAAQTTLST